MMMQPESGAKQRPSSFFNEKREGVRSLETPVLKRLVHKIQRLLAYILWLAIAVIIVGRELVLGLLHDPSTGRDMEGYATVFGIVDMLSLLIFVFPLSIILFILGVCLGLQARRKDASGDAENDAEENSGRASTNDGRGRS